MFFVFWAVSCAFDLASKLAKRAKMSPIFIYHSIRVIKNADVSKKKSVVNIAKQFHKNNVRGRKLLHTVITVKSSNFLSLFRC